MTGQAGARPGGTRRRARRPGAAGTFHETRRPDAYPEAFAVKVSAVVIGVRVLWQLGIRPLARLVPGGPRSQEGLGRRQRLVIGLGGRRGAISLAIALSLPAAAGAERGLLVLLAALVVLVTLVGQAPGCGRSTATAGSGPRRFARSAANSTSRTRRPSGGRGASPAAPAAVPRQRS
ncbi:cation:proton antiporter domain-containing protein [Actinomadura chokoriensis]|uniref:Cation:proton antiporter n=1 Tax=Actinomadura chokoriensis TaxID=454156 RepID=A0ABV4R804_9ACTN